jgi:Family of unknown function (DUF5681)
MAQFQPGESGNPGGRPKAHGEVRELAREHTVEAIETLVSIMRGGAPRAQITAAIALLDRGWGKPAQPITEDPAAVPVMVDARAEFLEIVNRIAAVRYVGRADSGGQRGPGRAIPDGAAGIHSRRISGPHSRR